MKANQKPKVGYVVDKRYYDEGDKILIDLLNKRAEVVPVFLGSKLDMNQVIGDTKDCKVIYNNATCNQSTFEGLEISKTLEEQGKKVINSSHSFYYEEDKWMFYLKCLEHQLSTPETHLISKNASHSISRVKDLLKSGPVILKAVFSERGKCVFKVDDYKSFIDSVEHIISKNPTSPIIAQKYIPNNNRSYRVTLIGNKVHQSVTKIGRSWKQTGMRYEQIRLVSLPIKVKLMCEKATRVLGMNICGLDLIENEGKWYLIEANSCPCWDFIYRDEKKLLKYVSDYLLGLAK